VERGLSHAALPSHNLRQELTRQGIDILRRELRQRLVDERLLAVVVGLLRPSLSPSAERATYKSGYGWNCCCG
jgi:hypothetical protein